MNSTAKIEINAFDSTQDKQFISEELMPYLSILYHDLIKREE